jgi:molybdopterin molybdotransferase
MRGEDVRAGTVVVGAGSVLRPQEIGVIASLGQRQVFVSQRPHVALLSTGDEVAEPGRPRAAGQIYDSNRSTLRGLVSQCGGEVIDLGIVPDEREVLRARLLEAGEVADVVITSGGVSVGLYDLVKDVLGEIGGIDFWQVAMQPGRPLAVGRIGSAHFFGLPGNPVASMLTFMLFVRPALFKLAGRHRIFPETWEAHAAEPMRKKPGRREFKRGVVEFRDGSWEVRTTGPQGSGILSSMVAGNCLIVLEEERGDVAAGELVLVEPF